jgi:hypothetical protein
MVSSKFIPFNNSELEHSKGCPHDSRVKKHQCENCGAELCYDCFFEDVIGKRTGSTTSIDYQTIFSFGKFCASCYLERIQDEKYRLYFRGSLFPSANMKLKKPTIGRITNTAPDFFYLFFGILFSVIILGIVMYGQQFYRANKTYKEFLAKFNKAVKIIEQIQGNSNR